MALNHCIAHQILRPSPSSSAQCNIRKEELPLDGKVQELIRELKKVFGNRSAKSYGQFSDDIGNFPFSSLVKDWQGERIDFASLTAKAMAHLKMLAEQGEVLLEDHVIFIQENLSDADYLYVFVVDHSEVIYLDQHNELCSARQLNASRLKLGAKINLTEWQNGGGNYLALLRMRGDKDFSDAFFAWLGFADQQLDILEETSEFLSIVADYSKQLPRDEAEETKARIVDYCIEQDKSGEPVVIEKLSHFVNENQPQQLVSFYEKKAEEKKGFGGDSKVPEKELIPHRASLRDFVRISGRDESLSMSFSASCLGESIEFDPQSETLVIKKLPKALKSRLLKHLRQG